MFNIAVVFAVILLGNGCRCSNVNRHMKMLEIDKNIEPNVIQSKRVASTRRFVSISRRPNSLIAHAPGTALQLTCDAIGSPAPSIHWLKNSAPAYEHDIESNEIIDTNPTSLARVTSTLIVTKTSDQDEYTCLVRAGSNTAKASTTVYKTDGSSDLSERTKLFPLAPQIVVSYKAYVDVMGSNVVLPCKVKGHPRPHITWKDTDGNIVKKDPRMKVLRSGELVISSLRWADLGEYTCYATNVFGQTSTKTFVYPAKAG